MFAFSAFGQGPHTEYYFIHQGEGGGVCRGRGVVGGRLWKSLCFERLLFLITARLFLKWIKPSNLAYTHTHIHWLIQKLRRATGEPVYRRSVRTWSLQRGQMYNLSMIYESKITLRPNESTCLMPLLGGFFFGVCVCIRTEFNGIWWGEIACLHFVKMTRSWIHSPRRTQVFFFTGANNATRRIKLCNQSVLSKKKKKKSHMLSTLLQRGLIYSQNKFLLCWTYDHGL